MTFLYNYTYAENHDLAFFKPNEKVELVSTPGESSQNSPVYTCPWLGVPHWQELH